MLKQNSKLRLIAEMMKEEIKIYVVQPLGLSSQERIVNLSSTEADGRTKEVSDPQI